MSKLISLCFPIFNRINAFKYTFSKTIDEICKLNSKEIEIIVSVNPENNTLEETKTFLLNMKKRTEIFVNINETNLGIGGNGRKVFELAHGKYIWMIGDDDFILPGCLNRVLTAIHEHPDIGWIHLAYGRLDGFPEHKESKITELTLHILKQRGYVYDGKNGAIKAHNYLGGRMLFSSANIFLKSAWQEVADDNEHDNPQLGATFCAASRCAVFFDDHINIVAGGQVSWASQADYSQAINYFRDMYFAIGHGFTKQEVDSMIKYSMRHEFLSLWFRIYRLVLFGCDIGKQSLKFFFHLMPIQTVVTTSLLPVIAIYLFVRHTYRNYKRKKVCNEYKKQIDADSYVVSRICS